MEVCGFERPVRLHDDHDVVGAVGEGFDLVAPVAVLVLAEVGAEAAPNERREREQDS